MNVYAVLAAGLASLAIARAEAAETAAATSANEPKTNVAVLAYEEPRHLEGSIYEEAPELKRLLFRFKRVATRSGATLKVERDFTYPDGRPAARERVQYEGNALVSYELEELQIGAAGSARINRTSSLDKGEIEFQYGTRTGKMNSRTEALEKNTLIADMVGPFLASNWDRLIRGDKVRCRFIVVPRKETVGFTFTVVRGSSQNEEKTVRVKMQATSRVLAVLVDPLFFKMEKVAPHRVLQYVGRTTPKLESGGGKWEDLDAITIFDWQSAR